MPSDDVGSVDAPQRAPPQPLKSEPGESMSPKRRSRRPDLFRVLLVMLAVGMTLTLGYQLSLYYSAQVQPVAEQAAAPAIIDG